MPLRVLMLLVGESEKERSERTRALRKAAGGKKLPAYIAFPPIEE